MGSLRAGLLGFFIWISLAQIKTTQAQAECSIIVSIKSTSASSLLVQWNSYPGATNYFLDLRMVNSSTVAPVVVTLPAFSTQKEVFGMRPGALYTVVVKVFQFYRVTCMDTEMARTVPDVSQITYSKAISSTAIALEWEKVAAVDQYFLLMNSTASGERYNFSYTGTSTVVQNLRPITSYDCYIFSSNAAGMGARSRVRTVSTLVQPPAVVTVERPSSQSLRIRWQPVDRVLLYKVTVTDSRGTQLVSTTTSLTFLDVQNVLPCSLYQISVSSVNTFLEPGESTQVNYTTNTLSPVTSVSVDYSCVSASATVSWGATFGAESYRVRAVSHNGVVLSCSSSGTSCQLTNVGCGGDYVVHVSAIANNCESTGNATALFQSVPCAPTNLELFRECSSNVIIFSWAPTNNTAFYIGHVEDSTGATQDCLTTETSCFFTETECGRRYSFTVYATTGDCNGAPSHAVHIRTAPCQPTNMISISVCQTDILTSTWDGAAGALRYIVEAYGNHGNGSRYSCSSVTNSCIIPGVMCGESLTMTITSFDDECPSEPALGMEAWTVPCAPQSLSPVMDCSSDSITLTWGGADGALMYIATALDTSGKGYTCTSMDGRCQITGLHCGTTYSTSVISTNFLCNSSVSNNVTVETAPCPPSQVQAALDCGGNKALVSWLGPQVTAAYTAMMEDQSGGLLSCSTTASSCWVPSLKCNQTYDISVTYHDGICPSKPSPAIHMKSVPCGPINVQAQVNCGSGVLWMNWNQTDGADGYTASVVATSNGDQLYCNSTSPSCSLSSLKCGESYALQVRSYNGTCLSLPSQPLILKEVPCVPTNVTVRSTCGNSTVVIWQASHGAVSYRVIAVDNRGHQTECVSNGTTCSLMDLQCSQVYNISVMAMDEACTSQKSQSVTLLTAPCAPTNVHSLVQCSTNTVTLSWASSPNAVAYVGRGIGSDGHTVMCNSTSLGCQLTGLHCGQDYTLRVVASDGTCMSTDSDIYVQPTAPCAVQAVSNFLHCDTNSISMSWAARATDLNYSALARPANGTALNCTSGSSSCDITGLQCGLNYTVVVTATNRVCTGPESVQQTVQTAPCMPVSVRASVMCVCNTVRASWGQTPGALSYTSVLTGPGRYSQSCSTSSLSCSFSNLTCAQIYTLRVVANDNHCNSTVSPDVSVTTAPCDPDSVRADLQCGSGVVNVSWHASAGASMYTVLAYGQNQTVPSSSCLTSSTSCALTQLQCGAVFNVSVLAGDSLCNSSSRAGITVKTAPCPPRLQAPSLSCIRDQAVVSWTGDQDAMGVSVNATSSLGHTLSCSSANHSCALQGLQCGQTYALQGTIQGLHCDSNPSAPLNIVTAPCTPAGASVDYVCGTSVAVLSWNESLGSKSFFARVDTRDHTDSCSSNQTHCTISSLLCGHIYNVSIQAVAGQCNSSNVAKTQLQTAPCIPQNVSVSLQCASNTASVSWLASPGAVGYNVTAVARDGDAKFCLTSMTTCQLPNMRCAQTYDIVVTPFSDTCKGFQSSVFTLSAGPCPPTQVNASLRCENSVGSVSWLASLHADMYIATATGIDGHTHTCTTNTTSCSFLDLHCGENYTITVVTVERGCRSDPSTPVKLKSAICPPANLAAHTFCDTSDISITWDPSPQSNVTYYLFSQQVGGPNSTSRTMRTSLTKTGLQCGWVFTVQVAAQDSTCTSSYSAPVQIHTAPCPPLNLAATAECGTNIGDLSWQGGAGALLYIADLLSDEGHSVSCMSNTTSCKVKLECGHHYTAAVVSSTGYCNSTANSTVQFDSASCLANNVQAQLNCDANTLAVQWAAISGNPSSYTALAINMNGTHSSCESSSTSCTIQSLDCGHTYGIAVTASTIHCHVQGSEYQVQSAPCEAESPSISLECSTNIATVRWDTRGAQQLYRVSAVNFTGDGAECMTTGSSCTFPQFRCGETYTVTVMGVTQQCTSQPSTTMELSTAPCIPTHVKATYDCYTSIATVTWDIAGGADSYTVYVVDSHGNSANCSTIDTTCDFTDLTCGKDYNVTVIAEHGDCQSLPSQPVIISTGPCPYSNLGVSLDCSSNSALVSWTPGDGILSYNASADAYDVADHVTCGTAGTTCNITNLQCAAVYQISVTGEGHTCLITPQEWVTISTGPCPPTQVSVQSSCDSDIVSVSWVPSQDSLFYLAIAQGSGGHKANCSGNDTGCDISGLQCGEMYEIFVSGVDEGCIGPKSEVHTLKTAPCVPQNVQTILGCQSTMLNVTWQQRGEASHYQAIVQSSDTHVTTCDTNKTSCVLPNILCGLTYNVAVVAQNEKCHSIPSSVQHAISAPCPPHDISVVLDCASNTISVNWSSSVLGVQYMAQATGRTRHNHITGYYTCNSTNTGCNITVPCGMTYNITVVPIQNGCAGAHSPYKIIQAAPCVPVLMNVEMDCLFDSAWVIWNESAGADVYTAMAMDSDGHQYECSSNDTMCAVPDLQCGKHYNFSVTAFNSQCSSAVSNLMESETAPCAPVGVGASVGCVNGTVTVWWGESVGAVSYTATLERSDGNTSCCTSYNTTYCVVTSLPCGQIYVLTVTAEGRTCNSSQSTATIIRTAPCTPLGLTSSVICDTNVATMSWAKSAGGLLYTVNAVSEDLMFLDSCNGFEGSCDLSALACGLQYTATVVAQDSTCVSEPSTPTHIRTVPCVPPKLSLNVDCQTRNLNVSWEESPGASFYTATLMDSWGHSTNCQSLSNSCNISGLACGNIYHASVVASDSFCSSQPSDVVDTDAVPCAPSNIQAVMDCQTGSAVLSWQSSAGALEYTATAFSTSGHAVLCESNETNCELLHLVCGSNYSISVQAKGNTCGISASMSGYLETGPCVVELVSVSYTPSVGQISWDMSRGAMSYMAMALTDQGLQTSCSSQDTTCVLYGMACSQTYNITLTAKNSVCQGGVVSTPVTVDTEPCPPTNVQVRAVCSRKEGVVAWEASAGAVSYVAVLEGREGDTLSCQTTGTTCSVSGLHCGTVYITTVQAIGLSLNSSNSDAVVLTTAPCLPDPSSTTVAVGCDKDTALVSWAWSNGASTYELTATSNDGYVATCASQQNYCNFTNLVCGQTYNLSLTADNGVCQVTQDTSINFQTRPCVPLHVAVNLDCGSSTAVLSWEQRLGVVYYQASATFRPGSAAALCNSTTDSCRFSGLQCGVEYSFTVRAHSHQCHSDLSSTVHVTTEPCQPQHLTVDGSCENNTLLLKWDDTAGALGYVVVATGNLGYTSAYQTNVSILEVGLPCGQSYSFTVMGQDKRCNSPLSIPAEFTTAPCVPLSLESFVQCENSVGSVSWASSDGAESYTVVARGQLGHTHMFSTNETVCTWSDLACGEIYTIRVVASNLRCSSAPSNSTVIRMAPCIPQRVLSSMDCDLKVGSLTWLPSQSAESYVVTAEASSGHRVELSTNSAMVQISELLCGQEYYLTVRAIGQGCRSSASNASLLQTEPCPPSAVFTEIDCFSNIAVVSWSLSDTADHYTAKALGPDGQSETCMSSSMSCGIATLQCGEKYNVTVTASSHLCTSAPSQLTYLNTAPCVPMGASVSMDCTKNEAHVSWSASQGAVSYQAISQSRRDDVSSCNSTGNDTHCILSNLTCGIAYTVQVVAIGGQCSSLPSQPSVFHTVPCSPDIGSVLLNCYANSLLLDWNPSGSSVSYTAIARATGGQFSSCSTNFTSCELTQLMCGQTYSLTVAASDGQCSSKQSTAVQVSSVPCRPEIVLPSMNCSSNSAHVQWGTGSGAESYEVHAIGTRGHVTGCNTTDPSCDLPNLQCGDVYNISVVAVSNQCTVTNNAVTQLHTVPCVPAPLDASLDCASGAVRVSWHSSNGATSYTAVAQAYAGFTSSCNSSSTTCVFTNLLCGLTYSFTVSASDNMCSSAYSHSIQMNTVPCEPHTLSAHIDCQSSTGLLSWEPGEGVVFYLVQAVGADGHQMQCHNTNASCSLPNMRCGQSYSLSVTAQDNYCNSSATHLNLQSVPCVPTRVQASLLCSSNSAAVTWQTASGVLGYQVEGVSADGLHKVSCNSSLPHCDLQQLHCGMSYNVTVVALDNTCHSGRSTTTQLHAAPCPPQNVHVQMNCSAGAMTVTWAANPDAESFHVDAVTSSGANFTCDTSGTTCSISGLPCGLSYSVTVRAVRGGCQSGPSTAVQTYSAPCIPQGEAGSLDCVTNSVWVSWQQTAGAESYMVMAVAANGANSSCSSSALFCNVPNLLCGVQYTFHITALNSQCASPHGNTFQIETAPCALMAITAETECSSTSISVSWHSEASSSFYVATAEGQDLSFLECRSNSTSCVLMGARCGMQYTILVSSSSDKCNSLRSPPYYINTAPCTPVGVTLKPLCELEGVLVSWAHSAMVQSYSLTATGQDGDVRTCSGPAENCSLTHLHCGQLYTVSLSASASNCTSPSSQLITYHAAPCAPQDLAVSTHCETSSATLSWSASQGSVNYFGLAHTSLGDKLSCETTGTTCDIEGLQCGMMYNFSVKASDRTCNSSLGQGLLMGAAPCPPASVTVRTHANLVRVYWSQVTCPGVEYLVELSGRIHDDPLALVQVSSYWTDRTYFELLVPCGTLYSVTVRARNQAGTSAPSAAVTGATVPCLVPPIDNTGIVGRRRRDLREAEMLAGLKEKEELLVPDVKFTQVTGVTLRVEWTPVTGASYYTLIVREDTPSRPLREVLTIYNEMWEVTDLEPATRYCVVLSAKNSVTQSAYSSPVCVTTEASM
ncbi:uncharacterized protein LOC108439482 [Pygocentrus nattereri]|uniref:Fibronectin type-III domain-containing protein n=1 Tax=Pygocentrus nattereri TaxID=42514 RepID=A0AAR2LSY1_PYGNA|nr:uncharacterized protein LOC108439482 [Pygocentrus nattereri]